MTLMSAICNIGPSGGFAVSHHWSPLKAILDVTICVVSKCPWRHKAVLYFAMISLNFNPNFKFG